MKIILKALVTILAVGFGLLVTFNLATHWFLYREIGLAPMIILWAGIVLILICIWRSK